MTNPEGAPELGHRGFSRGPLIDGALCSLVALAAFGFAWAYMAQAEYTPKHQFYWFGPSAMWASGHGFINPALDSLPGLGAFLRFQAPDWDPATLPQAVPTIPLHDFHLSHRNMLYAAALCWRIGGISWQSLDSLHALLYASTAVLALGLLRLGLNRGFSLLFTVLFMLSPIHLQTLLELRDYAKAPFILGALLAMGVLVRYPLRRQWVLIAAGALGAWLGVGLGFRLDMTIALPPAVLVLLFLLPGKPSRTWALRLGAAALFGGAFLLTSFHLLAHMREHRTTAPHNILGGMAWRFDQELGVQTPYYRLLQNYNDLYIHETINSFHRRTAETEQELTYKSPEYIDAGQALLRRYAKVYPADLVRRAYASTLRVVESGGARLQPAFYRGPWIQGAMAWLSPMLVHLHDFGRWYAAAALLLLAGRQPRWALFALGALFYFGGYPSLQFEPRHYFHLTLLGWWAMGFCWSQAWAGAWLLGNREARQNAWRAVRTITAWRNPSVRRAAAFGCAAFIGLGWLSIAAGIWQARAVRAQTQAILDAPRTALQVRKMEPADPGNPVMLFQPEGLLSDHPEDFGAPTQDEYLMVRIAGAAEAMEALVLYEAPGEANNFNARITVPAQEEGETRLFLPIYHSPTGAGAGQRAFMGVALPRRHAPRMQGIERVEPGAGIPFLPLMVLPAAWEKAPQTQRVEWRWRPYPKALRGAISHRRNLLRNGGFEAWEAGGAAPEGFGAPRAASRLTRAGEAEAMEGQVAVRQTWSASDGASGLMDKFHLPLKLQPGQTYELWVKVRNDSPGDVIISVIQLDQQAGGVLLRVVDLSLITAPTRSGEGEYAGRFSTSPSGGGGYYVTATYVGQQTPASVLWDDWRLLRLGPAR